MAGFRKYFLGLSDVFFKSHNQELPSLRKLNDSVYEFYSPPDGTSLNLEIIFFHGLEPEDCEMAYVETWTSFLDSTAICWPQTLLANEFPRARILSVSYDSSIRRGPRLGNLDLYITAENLVQDLIDDAKVATNPGLPVILVGKDFGGLVIEAICMKAKDQNRSTFLSNLKGIFYYGTPHLGVEDLRTAFNGASAERLMFGNKEIARLGSEFRKYRIESKWATSAILSPRTARKMTELLPSDASLRYDLDEIFTVFTDIDTVCKFQRRNSSSFQYLNQFISRIERGESRFESSPDQGQTEEGVGFKTSLGFVNDERYVPMERTLAEVENALQRARIVILHGGPGSGKSSLAKYLALQFEAAAQQQGTDVAATYSAEQSYWLPNGVIYMTCGPGAETVTMQRELLQKFGIELSLQATLIELEGAAKFGKMFRQALADHLLKLQFRVVVILDDVWDQDFVKSLLVTEDRVRYLLTTQISTLSNTHDSKRVQMQEVTLEDARHILGNYANFEGGVISEDLQNLGDEIIAVTGSHPLALATLGIVLNNTGRTIKDWQEVKANLNEFMETKDFLPFSFGQRYSMSVDASMMFVMDLLDEDSKELLYKITLFEGSFIPETLLRLFLMYTLPRDEKINISRYKMSLIAKGLVQCETVFEESFTHPTYGNREVETRGFRIQSLHQRFILTTKTEEIRRITYFLDDDSDHESVHVGERFDLNLATALCALYGATDIKRRAAKRIGSQMWSEESSRRLASGLKPFVSLMLTDGNTKNPISEAAAVVFHKYVFERELDNDKISYLLKLTAYPSAPLTTLAALYDIFSIRQVKLIDEDNLNFLKVIVSHLDPNEDVYKKIEENAPSEAPLIREYASRALFSICVRAKTEGKQTAFVLNVPNVETVLLALKQGAQSHLLARNAAQILDILKDEKAKGTEPKMFNAEGQLHPTGTDFVYTEQSDAVSDGVPENFPPHLPEGHSPAHLDGIVGRGVPDQKDVEESTTTCTTSDATSIPTNTKVDCKTRGLVETPQSSVRDGKGSKLLEVFLTEVNNSGGDGYFLSKKWLLTLDEHEREEFFLVLGRNGYLEIYETLTTVFYERTEEHVQVLSMYDDPSCAPENNDLCFRDENKVEPLDDGGTSSKIELTRFSATKCDGDLFNSSTSTLSLDNRTQLGTGKMNEISPSDAPSRLLEKGEMPLTCSTEMLKSLKTAVTDSSLYNYAVSTHWLSTLNDHQLEDLNSALSEAGYSEIDETSTTTYFERIQGRIKNCPTYETDTVGTSGRNDIGGDTENSGPFQGHGNSLADNHGSDVGGRDSLAVSEESSKTFTKCECPPKCLTVSTFDLNFTPPPSQSPIELSTSSSQGAYVFNTSSRQRVSNCFVTLPKNRKGYVISTKVDKDISMPTVTFTLADGYVPSEENVCVNVSAGTSLTCCLISDHDNKKVYIKFSTIRGEAKLGEPVDLEKTLALGSVRTNVHACIVDSERGEDFEEISLSLEEEYTRCPWKRMLKGGVWLAPSANRPQHSQFQSRTVELQCEVNKRAAADRRDCRREAHCLSFEGPPPVIMEGKIIGDLHQNSFLQLQIRYQVEIISFPKSSTPLRAGFPFVRTIRRDPQVLDFDCVLVMRTQNLSSEGSLH